MSDIQTTIPGSTGERLIFLDSETTGLEFEKGDRIVEIAGKEVVDLEPTGRVFHSYFNPGREVPPSAVNIHGLTTEFLQDKPSFEEKAEEFCEFVSGATLVIHNAQFDLGFIRNELELAGMAPTWRKEIDTLGIARRRYPTHSNNLDALADRFGIDRSARTLHGALLDAEILYKVYIPLMGLNQLIPLDMDTEIPRDACPSDLFLESARQRWFPQRPLANATDEELERHAAFVAAIAKAGEKAGVPPLWSLHARPAA